MTIQNTVALPEKSAASQRGPLKAIAYEGSEIPALLAQKRLTTDAIIQTVRDSELAQPAARPVHRGEHVCDRRAQAPGNAVFFNGYDAAGLTCG